MCVANNSPDIRELLWMFNKQLSAGFLKIIVVVLTVVLFCVQLDSMKGTQIILTDLRCQ
jgi:hypothetical protein